MNQRLKQVKQTIRKFLQEHYSDEKLCALLAHAQRGQLSHSSCCCLAGVSTSEHALRGVGEYDTDHGEIYLGIPDGDAVSFAFNELAYPRLTEDEDRDTVRRRRLIPIIRAELRRREQARSLSYALAAVEADMEKVTV